MALDSRSLRTIQVGGQVMDVPSAAEFTSNMVTAGDYDYGNELVRLDEIRTVSVADIDNPSTELANYAGADAGALLVAYEVTATANISTLYVWDASHSGGADIPCVVAGSSGYWLAIAGRYVCGDVTFGGAVTLGNGLSVTGDVSVTGASGQPGIIYLNADASEDNADQWRIVAADGNQWTLESYASGSWVAKLTLDSSGDLTVANDIILPADSDKTYYGAGKDASVYYDGTDLNIKTDEVAASDLHITTGAAKTVEFDTAVWDDLRVPLENTKLTPTKSAPAFSAWIDGTYLYMFEPTNDADESLHFVAQIPHMYKLGTDLHPHIHWSPSSTDTGNVVWELEYLIANINDTFGATAANDQITVAAPGTANIHVLSEFSDIDGSGIDSVSTMLVFRMTRRGDLGTDTFTGNAFALEFDIHYQRDTLGSREEHVK